MAGLHRLLPLRGVFTPRSYRPHGRVGFSTSGPTANTQMSDALDIEEIDRDLFLQRPDHLWVPTGQKSVFGGQIIAGAALAAQKTLVNNFPLHSLHSYFLLPGDKTHPVVYQVVRLRDGGSFETRQVIARQHGQAIFQAAMSFHKVENNDLDHQPPMPEAPPPETLPSLQDQLNRLIAEQRVPSTYVPLIKTTLRAPFPIDVRPVTLRDVFRPERIWPAKQLAWMRCTEDLPDDPYIHRSAIAYASDWSLASTALLPYGLTWSSPRMKMGASLDHAMYFHDSFQNVKKKAEAAAGSGNANQQYQPIGTWPGGVSSFKPRETRVRADEWLLYELESPVAMGSRGLNIGRIYTRDGRLIVSAIQEALIRLKDVPPAAAAAAAPSSSSGGASSSRSGAASSSPASVSSPSAPVGLQAASMSPALHTPPVKSVRSGHLDLGTVTGHAQLP